MDIDVTRVICNNQYIVIHDKVSRIMSFAMNIIDLDRWINISLVIKFSFNIGMGMDNSVTSLTIK